MTENRAAFLPWLLWNIHKQDHPNRELVVVDGAAPLNTFPSRAPEADPEAESTVDGIVTRLVRTAAGTSVAAKRNLALAMATGDVVAWFDDDDWHHPRRLSLLAGALAAGAEVAGSRHSWFLDPARHRASPHASSRGVVFNGLGARTGVARALRFDESRVRAADTPWVQQLSRAGAPTVLAEPLSMWLCHRHNLSNPVHRRSWPLDLAEVRRHVGARDWGDTDDHLRALRSRLAVAHC
ncbi:MAG: glycosyltransferase family A protein [Kineosporiaceae bacterium]